MMVEMSLQMRFSSSKWTQKFKRFWQRNNSAIFPGHGFRSDGCHWLNYFRLNFIEWKLYNTFSKLSFNFWQARMQIANKFCEPTPFVRPVSIPSDRNSSEKYGVHIHFGDLCAATIFIFTIYKYSKNEFSLTQHHPNSPPHRPQPYDSTRCNDSSVFFFHRFSVLKCFKSTIFAHQVNPMNANCMDTLQSKNVKRVQIRKILRRIFPTQKNKPLSVDRTSNHNKR